MYRRLTDRTLWQIYGGKNSKCYFGSLNTDTRVTQDYRFRSRTLDVLPLVARSSIPTFNPIEIKTILETALQYGVKVAAHSSVPRVMKELLSYGIHSIEHGTGLGTDDSARQLLKDWVKKETTFWVPTLSAVYTMRNLDGGVSWERAATAFKLALEVGMEHFACGGDTGVFSHGDNALEMQLMVRLGASWRKVLRWGTLNGWRCIRPLDWEAKEGEERLRRIEETGGTGQDTYTIGDNDVPFGAIRRGWAADIIAVAGDLENDFENAVSVQAIKFVMKGGKIFKQNGLEVSGL
jgi:imidazolonepropionase-like amidohydrolase